MSGDFAVEPVDPHAGRSWSRGSASWTTSRPRGSRRWDSGWSRLGSWRTAIGRALPGIRRAS